MLETLTLSCSTSKNLAAFTISKDGSTLVRRTIKIREEKYNKSHYTKLMYIMSQALIVARQVIEDNNTIDQLYIESSNTILNGWIVQGVSKADYTDIFSELLRNLDDIPVRYTMVYNDKPKASMYTQDKHIMYDTVSGLLD